MKQLKNLKQLKKKKNLKHLQKSMEKNHCIQFRTMIFLGSEDENIR